jgi:hypothetical protein
VVDGLAVAADAAVVVVANVESYGPWLPPHPRSLAGRWSVRRLRPEGSDSPAVPRPSPAPPAPAGNGRQRDALPRATGLGVRFPSPARSARAPAPPPAGRRVAGDCGPPPARPRPAASRGRARLSRGHRRRASEAASLRRHDSDRRPTGSQSQQESELETDPHGLTTSPNEGRGVSRQVVCLTPTGYIKGRRTGTVCNPAATFPERGTPDNTGAELSVGPNLLILESGRTWGGPEPAELGARIKGSARHTACTRPGHRAATALARSRPPEDHLACQDAQEAHR